MLSKACTILLCVCWAMIDVWPLKIITPMRKMHLLVTVVFNPWLADGLCLTVALHLKCGILSQHTSVRWHHPRCCPLLWSQFLRCDQLVWILVVWILSALPLPPTSSVLLSPWWQVCSLKSIWQPWPGKVHIWHWACHSPFIFPTPHNALFK